MDLFKNLMKFLNNKQKEHIEGPLLCDTNNKQKESHSIMFHVSVQTKNIRCHYRYCLW